MVKTPIYLDGTIIGYTKNPKKFVEDFRKKRRKGEINPFVSICYYEDENAIYINSDEGRALRPLIVVENGKPKLTKEHIEKLKNGEVGFFDLVKQGIIEFVDAEEEENLYIAVDEDSLTNEHTHMEIHPNMILGNIAGNIPFLQHNSSPRNEMICKFLEQGLGIYSYNFNLRMMTQDTYVLFYPENPIVNNRFTEIIGANDKPQGANVILAIMSYEGYNIDDAIILNKSSVERGLFRGLKFKSFDVEERRYMGGLTDRIEIPKPGIFGYRGEDKYKHLDEDGIVNVGEEVKVGDVVVGKTSPPRFLEEADRLSFEEKRRENSVAIQKGKDGIVDKVIVTETDEGNRLIRVRIRKRIFPEIGDKFAGKGQKGVVGLIVDEADLPISEKGFVPDLILTPSAIPSRMTVGYLMETIFGLKGAIEGKKQYFDPFEKVDMEKVKEELEKFGFKDYGYEMFYDGRTGKKIKARIFCGIIHYNRLHHMVQNKIQARSTGPVQLLTKQPTEGKAREGGLRFGEMERETLVGHGASMLLIDRMLEESDKTRRFVCNKCGIFAIEDRKTGKIYCPVCDGTDVSPIDTNQAFCLLINEIMSLCVYPKFILKEKVENNEDKKGV